MSNRTGSDLVKMIKQHLNVVQLNVMHLNVAELPWQKNGVTSADADQWGSCT
jgi:hypothetical protein